MQILTGIEPFVVTVLVLAAIAAVVAVGVITTFFTRNRSVRVRAGLPVRAYYRDLAFSH